MEKTVMITGASRGIGAACASAFGKGGYRVALCYHTQCEKAQAVADVIEKNGGTAKVFAIDVADSNSVAAAFDAITNTFGAPDILINNAGIAQQKLFTDITEAEWDTMMNTNAKGAFLCCKAALPHMIRQKWGRIVNISSMWGQVGASCEVHYSAAKAAVIGLTKALAKEEAPSGITVNCVAPGVIETDMMAAFSAEDKAALAAETPLERLGSAEDIAGATAFLASDAAAFITGQVIGVNGGLVI
ncbi:MAG: SDR family NAD(P)-dependent oxidoreductase [Ruthenibacterium sp.]